MAVIQDIEDTEVREEEPTKEWERIHNGGNEVPCAELENTRDQSVDVLSDEGAEGATIEAIDKK